MKIKFRDDIGIVDPHLKKVLKNKVAFVCSKIGFDATKVTWIIYKPKYNRLGDKENLYGYTLIQNKEIYISTRTIYEDPSMYPFNRIRDAVMPNKKKRIFWRK